MLRKSHKLTLALGCAAAAAIYGVGSIGSAGAKADVGPALPTQAELLEFTNYKVRRGRVATTSSATRRADAARLRITILSFSSAEEARKRIGLYISAPNGTMLEGLLTGRKTAAKVWRPKYSGTTVPIGDYGIVALDGPSIVIADLSLKIDKNADGGAKPRVVQAKDVRWVEDEALKCLSKLAKMGLAPQTAQNPSAAGTSDRDRGRTKRR